MRQLILVASLVGLFMYIGFVLQPDAALVTATDPADRESLAALERALAATGADLEQVVITGWVPVQGGEARERVAHAVGWSGEATPPGESRELKIEQAATGNYLALRWALSGTAKAGWQRKQSLVRQALSAVGQDPRITIQLEGSAALGQPDRLGRLALDAVGATGRQPWSDGLAASEAGLSGQLPPSRLGVNIQVAARRESGGESSHVWVAWPALLQEY